MKSYLHILACLLLFVSRSTFGQSIEEALKRSADWAQFADTVHIPCKKIIFFGHDYKYTNNDHLLFELSNKLNTACDSSVILFDASPLFEYSYHRYIQGGTKKIQSTYGEYKMFVNSQYDYYDSIKALTGNKAKIRTYCIETDFQSLIYAMSDVILHSVSRYKFEEEFAVFDEIYFNKEKVRDQFSRALSLFEKHTKKYEDNLSALEFYYYSRLMTAGKNGLVFKSLKEENRMTEALEFESACEAAVIAAIVSKSKFPVIVQASNEEVSNPYFTDSVQVAVEPNLLSECMALKLTDFIKIATFYAPTKPEVNKILVPKMEDCETIRKSKAHKKVIRCSKENGYTKADFDYLVIINK